MTEIYKFPTTQRTGQLHAPFVFFRTSVPPEWIDEFEHLSFVHYVTIGGHANSAFWNWVNGPEGAMEEREGHEYAIVENHVRCLNEIALGAHIHVSSQLIDYDDKRYLLLNQIWKSEDGALAATNEMKCLGFNLRSRRAEQWRATVIERLELVRNEQAELGVPCPRAALRLGKAKEASVIADS
ncbi:thioesterase family protein [Mesorhizobium australafricanum]|uniref:Thioesterase family protein n=1 Tax=Mesorhizobium australafricanum TaxID=3072311 RepID=A0ABU4X5Q5_9HYPH|nr:thioesterase family protein [Mesorhizobium sp. VK3E]MDX8442404.1 thioesterase family protein [Mesorhizobium sp. VK3E]